MTLDLTECQQSALSTLESGDCTFLTGDAGTGKSFLVNRFLSERADVPFLASTGTAAILHGGRTFHSFFGLGILQGGVQATVARARNNRNVRARLEQCDGVVIDEVSMISGTVLTAAKLIAESLRGGAPWGGLQVVVVGDFFQLPPVDTTNARTRDWAFRSEAWRDSEFRPAALRTIVRQRDVELLRALDDARYARVSRELCYFLKSRQQPAPPSAIRVFPRRQDAADYNAAQLQRLPGRLVRFETGFHLSPSLRSERARQTLESLKRNMPIPAMLEIKQGARVMIRKNDLAGQYANGSTGGVEAISAETVSVRLDTGALVHIQRAEFELHDGDGRVLATALNFPLNLAWATTIHKTQGMTLDQAAVDLSRLWEPGQAYVALSRVRSPEGLFMGRWSPECFRADEAVVRFSEQIASSPD